MCYSPTLIPNPNYGHKGGLSFMKDCDTKYIPVPCGHCAECVALKCNSVVQRCQLEELTGWPFYCTLTYNSESLPYHTCSDGVRIRYADMSDMQNFLKRLRKVSPRPFRYFGVSELGSKHGRPHFHLIMFFQRQEGDSIYTPYNLEHEIWPLVLKEWRRNYGSTRKPDYRPLCTYVARWIGGKLNTTYDFHYISSSNKGNRDDVTYYVTKYLFKDSDKRDSLKSALKINLDYDEYKEVWSKVRPRSFSSLGFGFGSYLNLNPKTHGRLSRIYYLNKTKAADHVRESIARSRQMDDKPRFYDLSTGKPKPLARYWYRYGTIYTPEDALAFHVASNDRADNVCIDERDLTSKLLSEEKYLKTIKSTSQNNNNFDLLYD